MAPIKKDNPKLWEAMDAWTEAKLFAALKGYFNLEEDDKVINALNKGDVVTIKKFTKKRLKAVGVSKPKFKKQKKAGLSAMDEPGTQAQALRIYIEKIWGKPKRRKKGKVNPTKKPIKSKAKKIERSSPHKNPTSPPNPDLPHVDAYQQARNNKKPNEILLYITHHKANRFTATYLNEKTRKRRELAIVGKYLKPLRLEWGKKRVKKAVPKSVENEKPKKKTSRY